MSSKNNNSNYAQVEKMEKGFKITTPLWPILQLTFSRFIVYVGRFIKSLNETTEVY